MYSLQQIVMLTALIACAGCLMVLMGLDKKLLVRRVERPCPSCGADRRDCRCRRPV